MAGTKENPGQVVHIQCVQQDGQPTASIQATTLRLPQGGNPFLAIEQAGRAGRPDRTV
jgi:hypothetical protein